MEGKFLSHWSATSILALVAALLIAGCGGDGQGSEGAAAYLRRLNTACMAHNSRAAGEILNVYDNPKVKRADSERKAIDLEAHLLTPILIANAEAQVRSIRDSDAPSEDEEQVKAILDAYRVWIDEAKQAPLKTVVANDVYNEARRLAGRFGLTKCELSPFEIPGQAGNGG